MDGRGSIPCGSKRVFSAPQRQDGLWGQHSLLSNGYGGLFFSGVKGPVCEADHSPPSSAEVKNGEAIPPHPPMSSWHSAYLSAGTNLPFIHSFINGCIAFCWALAAFSVS
jgi:hypothetical protein